MRKFYLTLAILFLFEVTAFAAAPTLINYQGLLTDNLGNALDTTANVTFRIFDVPSGGSPLWTETQSVTSVDGLFTVLLGTVTPIDETIIDATGRYLETQLGASPFSPRSQLVSTPYSIRVATVDGSSGGNISGKVNIGDNNSNLGNYAFVAGGSNFADGNYSFAAGQNNSAAGHLSTVSGGLRNTAAQYAATVGGGDTNQALGPFSTISGGAYNSVADLFGAIGGGYDNSSVGRFSTTAGGYSNSAGVNPTDSGVFVGGGYNNAATEPFATVGGGQDNQATAAHAAIGGGVSNMASGTFSTITGGVGNIANGSRGSVGGGHLNYASGAYATVPGGIYNRAIANYSFAAGVIAKANHEGAVVIAANASFTPSDSIASSGIEQMVFRADGGYYLTNAGGAASIPAGRFLNTSTGGYLSTAGVWTSTSDKNLKENFTEIDNGDVLEKVADLEITQWNYKVEGQDIKHVGPMGQDFYEKFGLGLDDKSISTVDASGVALAAIKALYQENQELKKRLEKLESAIQ